MSNVVRREPYAVDSMLDDLLKGFFVRPMHWGGALQEMESIRIDLKEGEHEYTVHADMPGVKKEDIHVTIEGNTVAVSAEVKKATEEKEGDKMLRSERYYGKVFRSFGLGQEVDETQAKAKFENGVLELHLPKKAAMPTRKLTVE